MFVCSLTCDNLPPATCQTLSDISRDPVITYWESIVNTKHVISSEWLTVYFSSSFEMGQIFSIVSPFVASCWVKKDIIFCICMQSNALDFDIERKQKTINVLIAGFWMKITQIKFEIAAMCRYLESSRFCWISFLNESFAHFRLIIISNYISQFFVL